MTASKAVVFDLDGVLLDPRARGGPGAVPGVDAFLAILGTHRIPCAVATAFSRFDADRVLAHLGLARRFVVVVTADDVRRRKPDPEVYLRAADGVGIEPGHCLVFEDAVMGVASARSAGMRVIGVMTTYAESELVRAGAERAIPNFEGVTWPL
ncbi:MAG TPA: HAD-IA family hydrolase [Methylomirabilota bacterium]